MTPEEHRAAVYKEAVRQAKARKMEKQKKRYEGASKGIYALVLLFVLLFVIFFPAALLYWN